MRQKAPLFWIAAVLIIVGAAMPAHAVPLAPLYQAGAAGAIADEYLVVLQPTATSASRQSIIEQVVTPAGGVVLWVYPGLNGLAAHLPAAALHGVRAHPDVAFVEANRRLTVESMTVLPPTPYWNLDRIDQRDLPLDGLYENAHGFTGAGVNVYIISSGIRKTHVEFGGRALHGFSSIDDGLGSDDCNGLGTHVAGLAGGATVGVAPGATLYAVRVVNCAGIGTTAEVVAGIDWVTLNHIAPAAAHISVGASASPTLDAAVQASIFSGVPYAVSPGSSGGDACDFSPGRVRAALTVPRTDSSDGVAGNQGECVDLFAPGTSVTSAWHSSDSAMAVLTGTSISSAHVAGMAALVLEGAPGAGPAFVNTFIKRSATPDRLSGVEPDTPNRLLYTQGR